MRILVTGSNGLLGKELRLVLPNRETSFVTRADYDIESQTETNYMIGRHRPDYVIHCAAKVGGLSDNQNNPYHYLNKNVTMNTNIINACLKYSVPRLLCFSSSCAYPDSLDKDKYPLTEDMVHLGSPTETNFSYGYAKRMLQVQIDSCNRQFGTKYSYIIPSNLYGENDNFGETGHFMAKLIKKIWEYKTGKTDELVMKGSGDAYRQYTHVSDLAKCVLWHMKNDITESYNFSYPVNLKTSTIAQIATHACDMPGKEFKFTGEVPIGQIRKDISIDKFDKLFPEFEFTSMLSGVKSVYRRVEQLWK